MRYYLTTAVGRLRLIGYLEGFSLLILLFIAVPRRYAWHDASWVKTMGPIHGILFLLFVMNTLRVGVEQNWTFRTTTWKVLVACMIPFGTFYIDRTVLRILGNEETKIH